MIWDCSQLIECSEKQNFWSFSFMFMHLFLPFFLLDLTFLRKSTRRSCLCSSASATQRSGMLMPMLRWVMEWWCKSSENCRTMVNQWGNSCKHLYLLRRWVPLPFSTVCRHSGVTQIYSFLTLVLHWNARHFLSEAQKIKPWTHRVTFFRMKASCQFAVIF